MQHTLQGIPVAVRITYDYLLLDSLHLIFVVSLLVKQMNAKFRQDDRDGSACFVTFNKYEVETKPTTKVTMSVKAISIQAVSQRMFVILDSVGDLHLLCLSNSVTGANISGHMRQLPHKMKVQNLATLPDVSMSMHLFLLCYVLYCF